MKERLRKLLKESSNDVESDTMNIFNILGLKRIVATDDTIHSIVNSEIKKLGVFADLSHIDVSKVTNMESLFEDLDFNGDISKWDVSNVKNMENMFFNSNCSCYILNWKLNSEFKKTLMNHFLWMTKFDGYPKNFKKDLLFELENYMFSISEYENTPNFIEDFFVKVLNDGNRDVFIPSQEKVDEYYERVREDYEDGGLEFIEDEDDY